MRQLAPFHPAANVSNHLRLSWYSPSALCRLQIASILLILFATHGCRAIDHNKLKDKSPLAALQKTPEQTELEVIFLHVSQSHRETAKQLWKEVDEQAIPARQRRDLNKNGFRVGVLGSQLPRDVGKILQAAQDAQNTTFSFEMNTNHESSAIRRKIFLRAGQKGELLASSVQEEFHVLQINQGEIQGRTFPDGQGQFLIEAAGTEDGRVKLKMLPEVHYGEFRNQYVPGEGMFRLDTSRRKERFDQLRVVATLVSDQILIIGPQPNCPGSLGHRFFNEQSIDQSISKLLLVRVCEIAKEPTFEEDPSRSNED